MITIPNLMILIAIFGTGIIVGYIIGAINTEKKYSSFHIPKMPHELTIYEQQEEALNEAKRIINDKNNIS